MSIAALARARLTAVTSRARAAFASIVDWRGEKVTPASLKGDPPKRQPKRASAQFGADPEQLVKLFKAADEGDPRQLQALLSEVEARDSHIGGVLDTRYKAATRVVMRAVAQSDDAKDVEIAEAVQRDILDAAWFRPMCRDLIDATLKGWAVCEIVWETGDVWRPLEIRQVDQQLTGVDPLDDRRLQWRDPADLTKLVPIPAYTAIVHAPSGPSGPLFRRGIGRALAILYSLKRLGLQAFATFVELYGVARPVVDYLDGTPTDDLDQLQADLEEWQSAGYLMKPHGINVTFPEPARSSSSSEPPHQALATFCDAQASKRIVGQTMTSDAGSSRSQAEVHERVAEHILEGDVFDLVATIVRDLVTPYVRLNYGDVAVPRIAPQLEANGQRAFQLEALKVLVPLGLRVEQSVVRDLGGFPEPAEGAEVLTPPGASPAATASPTGARAGAARAPARRGPAAFGPGVLYFSRAPIPTPAQERQRDAAAGLSADSGGSILPAAAPAPGVGGRASDGAPVVKPEQRLRRSVAASPVALAEADSGDDFMDTDGGAAAAGWREGMQPFIDGAQAAADASDSFETFLAKLREETAVDGDAYVRALATWTMQARGVGDGTDDT